MTEEDWQKQFEKYFLLSDSKIQLPKRESWFKSQSVAPQSFSTMRDHLNEVKSLLNSMPLSDWHKHTRQQNPAGFVVSEVRSKAHPELLTQAWCKLTEILHRFQVVPDEGEFKSLHLCEAPGAFITAMNHYIKSHKSDLNWSWVGSTLNPYYEGNSTSSMINDDRFILHTLGQWDFGIDGSGDLMKAENLLSFVDKYKFDFVTADGSVDCQSDPARQEALVENLHLAEILGAIGTLKVGGHFVLKMFTFFESNTLCHLTLLAGVFQKVHVFKPATSKEGNSEVYVICESFAGLDESALKIIIENMSKEMSLFDLAQIDQQFIDRIESCARFFMDIQESVIRRNIESFGPNCKYDNRGKKMVAVKFMQDCKITAIAKSDKIIQDSAKFVTYVDDCRQIDERVESGTFMDKLCVKSKAEQLTELLKSLQNLHPSWLPKCKKVEWISMTCVHALPKLSFTKGAHFKTIESSKFCPARAIHMHKQALSLSQTNSFISMHHKKRRLEMAKFSELKSMILTTPILASLVKMYPELMDIQTLVIKARSQELLRNPDKSDVIEFLDQIFATMTELKRGEHLIILDLVLLTRLQVGLFLVISHHFEEIGFMKPVKSEAQHGVFLSEYKGEFNHESLLKEIKEALGANNSLLSVLPTEYITEEPLYSVIVAHNINIMRESSISVLKSNSAI